MMNKEVQKQTFLSFGEILWDCLPKGLFLGGAPLNVAFHINQIPDFTGYPISAVGIDFLGDEVFRRMKALNLPTHGISRSDKQTGAVLVDLNSQGCASYRFLDDCAWDYIQVSPSSVPNTENIAGIICGTLAFRNARNREAFDKLKSQFPEAPIICDINLRKPFDDISLAHELSKESQIVKMNHEELCLLMGQEITNQPQVLGKLSTQFSYEHNNVDICVTAGSGGAGFFEGHDRTWYWESTNKVKVVDTVGSGDAFLASFLTSRQRSKSIHESLTGACRLGEFVATQYGATPIHP